MKRADLQRVDELLGLWKSYEDKELCIAEIIKSGPTQETKMVEFAGDFPQLTDYKPDILSGKVDRIRKLVVSDEELRAAILINSFPDKVRKILTEHYMLKGQNHFRTNTKWTHKDVAKYKCKLPYERYLSIREHIIKTLLAVDQASNISAAVSLIKSVPACVA